MGGWGGRGVGVEEGVGGGGAAGGQDEDDDRADHADRDGGAAALRDPRGRPHGGRRRRHQDPEVTRCPGRTSSWNARCAKAGITSPPRTGASTPSGWNGGSTARGATSTSRIRDRKSVGRASCRERV